jgi:ParB family transcriptional regulator, chromosome partitioning protein
MNGPENDPVPEKTLLRKKMGLGRGLDALLGEAIRDAAPAPASEPENGTAAMARTLAAGVATITVTEILANPDQPRRYFAEDALNDLAQSLKKHGVIQPIVVRPFNGGYQIVAGERRWRAAQRAQIHAIPAIVRTFSDAETLEIAIIENIQRQDLNPIEEAEAYRRLCDEFGHSQVQLAALVDKSRSHVANMMRLLDLPPPLRELVVEGKLQMGHARALLSSDQAVLLAAVVVKKGLSVRATEALVRKDKAQGQNRGAQHRQASDAGRDADIRAVETHLGDLLGLKVRINQDAGGNKGAVTFEYANLDQLDMLCQRLTGEKF